MADLKRIIRPFETPQYSPARVLPDADAAARAENVTLTIGKSGRGKTWTSSYSYALERYMTKQVVEKTSINPNDDPFNSNNDPFKA